METDSCPRHQSIHPKHFFNICKSFLKTKEIFLNYQKLKAKSILSSYLHKWQTVNSIIACPFIILSSLIN